MSKVFAVFLLALVSFCALAQSTKTVTYYYTDPQGTVLATADEQGNILSRSDNRPYGEPLNGPAAPGPGYTGHVEDPDSGLVYMQARYYDPVVGRFLTVDPSSPSAGDITNFSRFTYASNNPVVNVDPDGRQSVNLDAYSRHWPGTEQQKLTNYVAGQTGALVSIATMSNVFDVAPAGSGSGAVASAATPVEFIAAEGAALATRSLAGVARASLQIASEELAPAVGEATALPRMRLMDNTAKGAAQADYTSNWTLSQFEGHLSDSGLTSRAVSDPAKAVKIWSNSTGQKIYTTRGFSKTGGPTAELFHSGKTSAVAKIRLQADPSP